MTKAYNINSRGESASTKLNCDDGAHVEAAAYGALYQKFLYYTEVQLATLESLELRAGTAKSDLRRQRAIADDMMAVLVEAGPQWRPLNSGAPRVEEWLKRKAQATQERFLALDDSKALEQELSALSGLEVSALWAVWADENEQSILYAFNPGNSHDVCRRAERGTYTKAELLTWARASCSYHLVSTLDLRGRVGSVSSAPM